MAQQPAIPGGLVPEFQQLLTTLEGAAAEGCSGARAAETGRPRGKGRSQRSRNRRCRGIGMACSLRRSNRVPFAGTPLERVKPVPTQKEKKTAEPELALTVWMGLATAPPADPRPLPIAPQLSPGATAPENGAPPKSTRTGAGSRGTPTAGPPAVLPARSRVKHEPASIGAPPIRPWRRHDTRSPQAPQDACGRILRKPRHPRRSTAKRRRRCIVSDEAEDPPRPPVPSRRSTGSAGRSKTADPERTGVIAAHECRTEDPARPGQAPQQ